MGARVPEILADLSAVIGEKTPRGVPNLDLVRRIWRSLVDLRPTFTGFRRKPRLASCRNTGGTEPSRVGGQGASGQPIVEVLPAHDVGNDKHQQYPRYNLGNLVNRGRDDRHTPSLEQLAETTTPRERATRKRSEKEARGFAKPWTISQSGPGVTAFLRARPIDSSRVIQASEFVSAGRRVLTMEDFLAMRLVPAGVRSAQTGDIVRD